MVTLYHDEISLRSRPFGAFQFPLAKSPKEFPDHTGADGPAVCVRRAVRGLHHRSRLNRTEIAEFSPRRVSTEIRLYRVSKED